MGEPALTDSALERTLRALRAGTASLADVREALRDSDVFVPRAGRGSATNSKELGLPTMELGDGQEAVPLFSSSEALASVASAESPYVRLPFEALVPSWPEGVDAVLDPGQGWALHVPGAAIREGGQVKVPEGTRVIVGEPADEQEPMLAALADHFSGDPAVQAAWRAQVLLDRPGEVPHLAIGVRLSEGADARATLEAAARVARRLCDAPLDLLIVDDDRADPIAKHMLERLHPFFLRQPSPL